VKLTRTILLATFACVLTSACVATTEVTEPLKKTSTFGDALSGAEYSSKISGNTITGVDGSVTYYKPDGVKLTRRANGEMVVRKWHIDDNGVICQTLNSSGKLDCLNGKFVAYQKETTIKAKFSSGGEFYTLILSEGNSENLVEP